MRNKSERLEEVDEMRAETRGVIVARINIDVCVCVCVFVREYMVKSVVCRRICIR